MKAIKITGVVSVSSTGVYTIVPVIEREPAIWVKKSTGEQLTEDDLEGVASSDIEVITRLKENGEFWTKNPSMNFRLAPDNEAGRTALHAGDVVDISITRR